MSPESCSSGDSHDARAVGITVEPEGTTPDEPTSKPIALFTIPSLMSAQTTTVRIAVVGSGVAGLTAAYVASAPRR